MENFAYMSFEGFKAQSGCLVLREFIKEFFK